MNESGRNHGELPQELQRQLEQLLVQTGYPADEAVREAAARVDTLRCWSTKMPEHRIEEPVGAGGGGTVYRIRAPWSERPLALKLLRPGTAPPEQIPAAAFPDRRGVLPLLRRGSLDDGTGWSILPLLESPRTLTAEIDRRLAADSSNRGLQALTRWLARQIHRIARTLTHLHDGNLFHFDIKPGNILFAGDRSEPYLTDLEFCRSRNTDPAPLPVSFTPAYAHPELRDRIPGEPVNREQRLLQGDAVSARFDIYALGKTVLESISRIEHRFPDSVVYDYTFAWLHLAACRMLDGRNLSRAESDRLRQRQLESGRIPAVYSETWLELDGSDFFSIRYTEMSQIVTDLEKLLWPNNFLDSIEELHHARVKKVMISEGPPAPFSNRVRAIIEHPVFSRLHNVPQLELMTTIYPTANHTRFEHSLGVFRNAALYIRALCNDPYNPLFMQLMDRQDLKALLLACLLHDLGQYPFGHTLEEVGHGFRHENYTLRFLENPTKDRHGRTIQEIIEDPHTGWGVPLEQVQQIIGLEKHPPDGQQAIFPSLDLKTTLLASVLDGPIDVDKLDYLQRDSRKCFLNYGDAIDVQRLLDNLTIILTRNTHGQLLVMTGVYEKGECAAEVFTFTRYLLYQSIYWHHSSRALRSMVQYAVRQITAGDESPPLSEKKLTAKFDRFLGIGGTPSRADAHAVLDFISPITSPSGQEILNMVRERNYYKRILSIHSNSLEPGLDRFRRALEDPSFSARLQLEISRRFDSSLAALESPGYSLLSPELTDKTARELRKPGRIICDCPKPSIGAREKLRLIPEPKRLMKNYARRADAGERVSEVWADVHSRLMETASQGRVFCHPEIRDTVMAALGPDGIRDAVLETIRLQ